MASLFKRLRSAGRWLGLICLLGLVFSTAGCIQLPTRNFALERHIPPPERIPNGEFKTTLPPYVIEPPDFLLIDAKKVVPKAPYKLEPLDYVQIKTQDVAPDHPLEGNFQIEAAGTINLGVPYGTIKAAGMTVEELTDKLLAQLKKEYIAPQVSISLLQTAGTQQISGEHLVAPDGTVNLGTYGQVYVAGMTLAKARAAIEKHLGRYLESPQVTVDVASYNSKVYYVIFDGAGSGDRVVRLPITGGETVLDAMSQMGGLSPTSTKQMWIARPAPDRLGYEQRLPVNWDEITRGGIQATNYQLLPGDRLFVSGDKATTLDVMIARVTAPLERISGVILLGTGAVRNLSTSIHNPNNNNGL